MKQYLGVDIGGTAVKLGIVTESGTVLRRTEQSVCFDGYQTPILTTVQRACKDFLKEYPTDALAGIGVSATGQIDSVQGIVAPEPAAIFPTGQAVGFKKPLRIPFPCPLPWQTMQTVCCWEKSGLVPRRAIPMSSG